MVNIGLFLVSITSGVITGVLALYKGREFFIWFVYGATLIGIAPMHAWLMEAKGESALKKKVDHWHRLLKNARSAGKS